MSIWKLIDKTQTAISIEVEILPNIWETIHFPRRSLLRVFAALAVAADECSDNRRDPIVKE